MLVSVGTCFFSTFFEVSRLLPLDESRVLIAVPLGTLHPIPTCHLDILHCLLSRVVFLDLIIWD